MKRATIFKDEKGYILFPMSRTLSGFYISTEPKVRILNTEFEDKMIPAFFEVVRASADGVADPKFDQKIGADKKSALQKTFKKLKIKSFKDLDKRPVLNCDVEFENNVITFIPKAHDLSMNGRGYTRSNNEPMIIHSVASEVEILKSIQDVFARCE
jgi:hypothetical protein